MQFHACKTLIFYLFAATSNLVEEDPVFHEEIDTKIRQIFTQNYRYLKHNIVLKFKKMELKKLNEQRAWYWESCVCVCISVFFNCHFFYLCLPGGRYTQQESEGEKVRNKMHLWELTPA
jgi:hypothetical protein